ncbi:uncharacterized protein LOC124461998 [Drosophila willistoni]|uniref:uncharacterized protein LOC124461998 n=1 Tax=Drosophila willistoni TaxID=7260 RepID=UPI001F07D6AD|nr:uncharacterized protein LOC124461998 [Drosophila willistoni]
MAQRDLSQERWLDEGIEPSESVSNSDVNLARLIANAMATAASRQNERLEIQVVRQTELLTQALENGFQRLYSVVATHQVNAEESTQQAANLRSQVSATAASEQASNGNSILELRPDRISQVISSWKLRFNGKSGISVDEFIYRAEAMTHQALEGNFVVLSRYVSNLFEGNASEWFWRYHKKVSHIKWLDLCRALREQFKDERTDQHIKAAISKRRQGDKESFDEFYEAIVTLADKLSTPLPEIELLEHLRANLLPDIQHELLYESIASVSKLRQLVRTRETFMQTVRKPLSVPPRPMPRRVVNAVSIQTEEESEAEDELPVVEAVNLVCWNCDTAGHPYQECVAERRVFCYGCSQNVVPDALSRVFTPDLAVLDSDLGIDLNSVHFLSPEYVELKTKVEKNPQSVPDVKVMGNLVYRRSEHFPGEKLADDQCWKLWIPKGLVAQLLKLAHESPLAAHCGINKTLEKLRRYYYLPNLVSEVKEFINRCDVCKATKHPNYTLRPPLGKSGVTSRFFERLYVDFLGPYPRSKSGNIGIFIVVDHFSKFPFLKKVKKFTAEVVTQFLEEDLFHCFGVPEIIVSDNGPQFRAHHFNELLQRYKVRHTYTAAYALQADVSERVNRSVLAAVKAYVSPSQSDWDEKLSSIACALRSTIHSAINTTPYRLAFGQHMVTDGSVYQVLRNLELLEDRAVRFSRDDSFEIMGTKAKEESRKQHERNENLYNLRSREVSFSVGQEVFRRNFQQSNFSKGFNSKLAPPFVKARVRRKLGNAYYELENLQGHLVGKFHAKDIKQ